MKTNFHTHIYRCGHASGDVEDYVLEGIKKGYSSLGISDHGPLPNYLFDRMPMDDLEAYIDSINLAKEKYFNKINIFSALELEYFQEFEAYYKELKDRLDYLILAIHYFPINNELHSSWDVCTKEHLDSFVNLTVQGIESNTFDFLAHPDLFLVSYNNWDEYAIKASYKICQSAKKFNMPIEFNANGIRKGLRKTNRGPRYLYPNKDFWDIAKEVGVKVIVNSDCHRVEELDDESMKEANKLAKKWGLSLVNKWR